MSKHRNIIRKCLLTTPNVTVGPFTAIRRIFGPQTFLATVIMIIHHTKHTFFSPSKLGHMIFFLKAAVKFQARARAERIR